MRLTTFLMASAASILALTAVANAADPVEAGIAAEAAPAPASSSVSVCDAIGPGYFVIPGGETCLKIGGAVEATVGHTRLLGVSGTWAGVEARLDVDTHTDSEIGAIGSKFRASFRHNTIGGIPVSTDDLGVELAYLTVGPVYAGFKETLFDKRFGYGSTFDLDSWADTNALTVGFLHHLDGGYYVGAGIETAARGLWLTSYDGGEDVDFVARAGVVQGWGSTDLSAVYSEAADSWAVKSTTDFKVLESTELRIVGAFADVSGEDAYLLTGGVNHGFTEQVSAFGGIGYVNGDALAAGIGLDDAWLANAGVTYTPIEGFDVTGELGYANAGSVDAYNTTVKFIRTW